MRSIQLSYRLAFYGRSQPEQFDNLLPSQTLYPADAKGALHIFHYKQFTRFVFDLQLRSSVHSVQSRMTRERGDIITLVAQPDYGVGSDWHCDGPRWRQPPSALGC